MSAAAVENSESTLTSANNQQNESRHHSHSSSSSSSYRGLPLLDLSSLGTQPHHHRPISQPHTALSASALSPLVQSTHHHHSNLIIPSISSHLGFASASQLAGSGGSGSGEVSASSTPSCLGSPIPATPVKETNYINVDYDPVSGRKLVNTYEIIRELGRGQHGKVKLGRDLVTGDLVAIKVVDRTSRPRLGRPQGQGSTQEEKVRREIAILKKCIHPNIVRLREVLDDASSKKIFLVLEYCEKGEVGWQTEDGKPLQTIESAQNIFREVLLGVEYLHCQGIIHRDIKPANLLVSKDDVVKISDFGVSYLAGSDDDDLELAKTAGTPAFFAPEVCYEDPDKPRPKITEKIDIWALGVTLYCLVYGSLPFIGDNEFELFQHIATEPLTFPKDGLEDVQDLLRKLLKKDPTERMTIQEIKQHPWVCAGLTSEELQYFEQQMPESISRIQVSHEEVEHAVVGFTSRIRRGLSKLGSTALQIAGIRRRPSSSATAASKSRTRSGSNRNGINSNCTSPQSHSRSPSAARNSSYRVSPSSNGYDLLDYVHANLQEPRSRSSSLATHSTTCANVNAQDSAETLRPPLQSSLSLGLPTSNRRPSASSSSTSSKGRGYHNHRRRTSTGSDDLGPVAAMDEQTVGYNSKYPHPASITTAMLYHHNNISQQTVSPQTRQAYSSENLRESTTPSSSVGSTPPEWLNAVRSGVARSGSRHKVTERGPLRPRPRAESNQSSNAVFSFSDSDHDLSEDTDDVSSLSMSLGGEDEAVDNSPHPGSSPGITGVGSSGLMKVPLVRIPELQSSDAPPMECDGDEPSQLEKRTFSTSSVVSTSPRAKRSSSGSSSNYKSGSNGNNSFASAGSSKEALLRTKLKELQLKSAANSDNDSSDDDDGDLVLVVENRRSRRNTVNEQDQHH